MTIRRGHLMLIPGGRPVHVLLVERSDAETADVVCTCGAEWAPMHESFVPALAEHHEAELPS